MAGVPCLSHLAESHRTCPTRVDNLGMFQSQRVTVTAPLGHGYSVGFQH